MKIDIAQQSRPDSKDASQHLVVSKHLGSRHGELESQLRELNKELNRTVTATQARNFVSSLRASINDPDLFTQGGTSNCFFVDRITQLLIDNPEQIVSVIRKAAQDGEISSDYFRPDESRFVGQGFGHRTLCARVIQRWVRGRLGLPEDQGANEENIKESEYLITGHEHAVVSKSEDIQTIFSRENPHGVGVLLRWIPSDVKDLRVGSRAHVYHRLVIDRIEDGKVYLWEGVKSKNLGGPATLDYVKDRGGHRQVVMSIEDFNANTLGIFVDKRISDNLGVSESCYNRTTPFAFGPSVPQIAKSEEMHVNNHTDEYRELLKKHRSEDEEELLKVTLSKNKA